MPWTPQQLMRWWTLLHRVAQAPGRVHRCRPQAGSAGAELGGLHPVPTLILCLAGVVRVELASGPLDLGAGDLALIASGTAHRHAPLRRGCIVLEQGFDRALADLVVRDPDEAWSVLLPGEALRPLVEAVLEAKTAARLPALAAELLRAMLEQPWHQAQTLPAPAGRMLAFLRERALQRITARDILAASGLGRSQAHAVFVAAFGSTPAQALRQRRCLIARGLLRGGMPVAAVARHCGFDDRSTFQRAYRRCLGCSPRDEHGRDSPPG